MSIGSAASELHCLDIEAAVSKIGNDEVTLIITTRQTLTAHLTVPANVKLVFYHPGLITLGVHDLFIYGQVSAGLYRIFDDSCTGNVLFAAGATNEVYPEWWYSGTGAYTAAIQSAIYALGSFKISSYSAGKPNVTSFGGGTIRFSSREYLVDSSIKYCGANTFVGNGPATVIKFEPKDDNDTLFEPDSFKGTEGYAMHGVVFRDLYIEGNLNLTGSGKSAIGIDLTDTRFGKVESCHIRCFRRGIYINTDQSGAYYNSILNCFMIHNVVHVYIDSGAAANYIIGGLYVRHGSYIGTGANAQNYGVVSKQDVTITNAAIEGDYGVAFIDSELGKVSIHGCRVEGQTKLVRTTAAGKEGSVTIATPGGPTSTSGALLFTNVIQAKDILESNWEWTASGASSGEYFIQNRGGGDPKIIQPASVYEMGIKMTEMVDAGALLEGEWAFCDNDDLGFETVYVRISGGTDPSLKPSDYVQRDDIPLGYHNNTLGSFIGYEQVSGTPVNTINDPSFKFGVLPSPADGIWFKYNNPSAMTLTCLKDRRDLFCANTGIKIGRSSGTASTAIAQRFQFRNANAFITALISHSSDAIVSFQCTQLPDYPGEFKEGRKVVDFGNGWCLYVVNVHYYMNTYPQNPMFVILGLKSGGSVNSWIKFANVRMFTGGFPLFPAAYTSEAKFNAKPSVGYPEVGDKVWNSAPSSGNPMGWICTNIIDTTVKNNMMAGATKINVTSTSGMTAGDNIGIALNSGLQHWTTIDCVVNSDTLSLTSEISAATDAGNDVWTHQYQPMPNL